jgi:uncharacterized phiE125 gp8 family phage protein
MKAHLRIDNNASDGPLTSLIVAARNVIEEKLERSLITQTWRLTLDRFPDGEFNRETGLWEQGRITVPRPRLQTVSSITYVDTDGTTQTLDPTLYSTDPNGEPGRISPAFDQLWPTTRDQMNAVTITYTAGYGTTAAYVPVPILLAIKLLVGHWYENREASTAGAPVTELPMGVDALLGPYRIMTVR